MLLHTRSINSICCHYSRPFLSPSFLLHVGALMSDDMCLLLKASSADRAEENLVLRHMGHAVRDQEPASLVVVGAVPPSASGIVELESRHWKADVVVVDVRPYQC